jgi:hypothetical protein
VTPTPPTLLLDTCAIINLSYCSPVATLFKTRYAGRAGWTRAVQAELTRQRSRNPPHPQAGRASNWATSWLPSPVEIVDSDDQIAIAVIQTRMHKGGQRARIGGGAGWRHAGRRGGGSSGTGSATARSRCRGVVLRQRGGSHATQPDSASTKDRRLQRPAPPETIAVSH